jgi:hypothetical protein
MTTQSTPEAKDLQEVAEFIMDKNDKFRHFDESFGEFLASSDQSTQTEEWHCWGCDGIGTSCWPEWELHFDHDKGCKYLKAREVLTRLRRLT